MPNILNQMVVRELTDTFRESTSMVIVSMNGLTMEENEDLRNSLAEGGAMVHMVRNSLAKRALAEVGVAVPDDVFQGNVAMICGGPEEAIHSAKIIKKSDQRKNGKVDFRAGVLEGEVLDAKAAVELADMPDVNSLRAMMLGVLSAPARQLVSLINAPGSALARVVQAHVDDQGGEGAAE